MRHGQLHDRFVGVGAKRLSAVDAEPGRSNQHEVGTTRAMREQFLGEAQRQEFRVRYIWLGEGQNGFSVDGTATHYDARENKSHRSSEWRLYYRSNAVTEAMREGDALFLALHNDGLLYFIVAPESSTGEHQMLWLFGLELEEQSFVSREFRPDEPELDFAAHYILDEIGVEFEESAAHRLDEIIERFGLIFPSTADFSTLARETLPHVRPEDGPDEALLEWLSHEEAMFRCLERRVVSARLEEGFADGDNIDVDGFISFSLSVQNRRKSRRGHSLEHHLEAVFRAFDVAYVRGAVTENGQRPDFLFPNAETYRSAPKGGLQILTMLGAKSTCKDRWRQVLAEAAKIPRKHLLTLEPGISESQTSQMNQSNLQLVVPEGIHKSYTDAQRTWLWNLKDFVWDVKYRNRN